MRMIEPALFMGAAAAGFVITVALVGLKPYPTPVSRSVATVEASFSDVPVKLVGPDGKVTIRGGKAKETSPLGENAGDVGVALATSLTADESASCARKAKSAETREQRKFDAAEANYGGAMMPFSPKLGAAEARIACWVATRPSRLCDPEQRRDLVALINLYFSDYDAMLSFTRNARAPEELRGPNEQITKLADNFWAIGWKEQERLVSPIHTRLKRTLLSLISKGHLEAGDFEGSRDSEALLSLLASATNPSGACVSSS